MVNNMKQIKKLLLVFLVFIPQLIWASDNFLSPEQAFSVKWQINTDSVVVNFQIAEGYYLYKSSISAKAGKDSESIQLKLPQGTNIYDKIFNKNLEVYPTSFSFEIPNTSYTKNISYIDLTYQGCAKEGLCYPPETMRISSIGRQGQVNNSDVFQPQNNNVALSNSGEASDPTFIQSILVSDKIWKIIISFIVFGVLLSFTPCVLPMIPILSSIIIGKSGDVDRKASRSHPTLMAVSYSAGMITVYTGMGIVAGLLGESLSIYLQQPYVLITFATMIFIFGLSMLDVIKFEMPGFLQNKLLDVSSKASGGRVLPVFIMGAVSSLIIGPCVAGPLAGTLIYIGQTKDVMVGGAALFSMALGMSVPLILTGMSANHFLPKVGPWMIQVKSFFGFMLFAIALWMLVPVIPVSLLMFLLGLYAILAATYLGIFKKISAESTFLEKLLKISSVMFFFIGISQWVGLAAGNENIIRPLSQIAIVKDSNILMESRTQSVKSVAELDHLIKVSKQPIILDFYADWCVSCKELEVKTFADDRVINALENFKKIKVDVTQINVDSRTLLKKYELYGPPAILFVSSEGKLINSKKIIGFIEPDKLAKHLQTVQNN